MNKVGKQTTSCSIVDIDEQDATTGDIHRAEELEERDTYLKLSVLFISTP